MPINNEQCIKLRRFQKESKEIRSIILKLMRTEDSEGCFNPYNVGFDYLVDCVHEVRELLRSQFETKTYKNK